MTKKNTLHTRKCSNSVSIHLLEQNSWSSDVLLQWLKTT